MDPVAMARAALRSKLLVCVDVEGRAGVAFQRVHLACSNSSEVAFASSHDSIFEKRL